MKIFMSLIFNNRETRNRMRITISFKHREDFERTKRLIRKAGRLEQECRKLGDAEIGIIHSAMMRSDIKRNGFKGVPSETLHEAKNGKVSNQLYQEGTK